MKIKYLDPWIINLGFVKRSVRAIMAYYDDFNFLIGLLKAVKYSSFNDALFVSSRDYNTAQLFLVAKPFRDPFLHL